MYLRITDKGKIMLIKYEIVCIQKGYLDPSRGAISSVGYKRETGEITIIPVSKAVEMIKNKECGFYVTNGSNKVEVFVKTRHMGVLSTEEYLTTASDESKINNLENLRNCQ